jgi:Ni,Fe-hydrogenase III small subunit
LRITFAMVLWTGPFGCTTGGAVDRDGTESDADVDRHADGILVTGPVSENMKKGLLKTYDSIPDPKIVIAVGACAISGGPFVDHNEVDNGVTDLLPVDLFIPGCPPPIPGPSSTACSVC